MKAAALNEWLSSQIEVLEAACGRESSSGLRRVSGLLALRKNASVGEFCNVISKLGPCNEPGARIEPVAKLLVLMVASACKVAKASDAKDLKQFSAVFEDRRNQGLDGFVLQATEALASPPKQKSKPKPAAAEPLSESELQSYLKRLEQALGDDLRFNDVYQQVTQDARVKAPEAKKLAKAFAGRAGGSKGAALGLIYGRHKNTMSAAPKADATAGRLAG